MLTVLVPDFQEAPYVQGLATPTDIVFAPDGRLFIAEKAGRVRIVDNGVLLDEPFLSVSPDTEGERGLQSVAFDPNFAANGYVYVYYTRAEGTSANRLSRFTVSNFDDNVADPTSEVVLLDDIPVFAVIHNGGALGFGHDGMLYLGTGEGGVPTESQDLGSLAGKLLRLDVANLDDIVPADNPFVGQAGARGEIYALGLRNPFKLDVDQQTGRIWVTNTGSDQFEEIHEAEPGGNFGWPLVEGESAIPRLADPVSSYAHTGVGGAITGGAFYSGTQFPVEYEGDFFFTDFSHRVVRRIDLPAAHHHDEEEGEDEDHHDLVATDFATLSDFPVDIAVGPDGALYYAEVFSGTITRIEYIGSGNRSPLAVATADATIGTSPMTVEFSAALSSDPDNDPLTYTWNFGDGSPLVSGLTVSHVYANPGVYFATVTVDDGEGGSDTSDPLTIAVDETPPVGQIDIAAAHTLYRGGDTIVFSGTGIDAEDGALGSDAFRWTIAFHHNSHVHPFLGPITGTTGGSFVIPTLGETSANVWYRVTLTVTDSSGLSHTTTADIFPQVVTTTLDTNIPGLELELDGQQASGPIVFDGVAGIQRLIAAPLLQDVGGSTYVFQSWSDGGQRDHTIATPTSSGTIVATYVELDPKNVTSAYFVAGTYEEVLQRAAEPTELFYYIDRLAAGEVRTDILRSFWASAEYRALDIRDMYDRFLDRTATDEEVVFWVAQMGAGLNKFDVAASILSSSEFVTLQRLQPPVYVAALYDVLLDREGSPAEIQYYVDILEDGASHADVARRFLLSPERYNVVLRQMYRTFLNRELAPHEASGLYLASIGADLDAIAGAILASAEFQTLQTARPVVRALYDNLLRRLPVTQEVDHWVEQLAGGETREAVVSAFHVSPERLLQFVSDLYSVLLLRLPTAGEAAFWSGQLAGGMSEAEVVAKFFASEEYTVLYPGDGRFVHQLYQRLLGRPADLNGMDHWMLELSQGASRSGVASALLNSPEYRTYVIDTAYQDFLGRLPAANETDFWLTSLPTDGHLRNELLVSMLASEEYYEVARPISPAASADALALQEAFIIGLYDDLLDRAASAEEVGWWIDEMALGKGPDLIARAIWLSEEHGRLVAEELFSSLLDRQPTAQEVAHSSALLRTGEDVVDVTYSILTTAEYSGAHAMHSSFVAALYPDLFDRAAAQHEITFWVDRLDSGDSRSSVVAAMQDSPESWNRVVDAAFNEYLQREPTASDALGWGFLLASGYETPRGLAWALLGSDAYSELHAP